MFPMSVVLRFAAGAAVLLGIGAVLWLFYDKGLNAGREEARSECSAVLQSLADAHSTKVDQIQALATEEVAKANARVTRYQASAAKILPPKPEPRPQDTVNDIDTTLPSDSTLSHEVTPDLASVLRQLHEAAASAQGSL